MIYWFYQNIEYNKKSDSVLKIISETTDQQSMQFLESGRNFLLDPDFKNRWSSDSVFGEISFLIKEYISEIY
jgi:hypothetical protein